jgi:hypothetical protein
VTIPWYANVLLWIAALGLVCRWPNVATVSSLAAITLALTTFAFLGNGLRAAHVGYFLWLASMVLVFVASCVGPARSRAPIHSSSSSSDVAGEDPAHL